MVRSYLRMYEQSGWLPSFPSVAGDQAVMIGHHAAALILDLYTKGYRDFDVNEAYAAMRKNPTEATMLPWRRGPLTSLDHVYFEKGFFPALARGQSEDVPEVTEERRQAVSVTLESSYDGWCVAELAAILGKQEDKAYFMKLAHNYENVFNPAIGFMAPKSADGRRTIGSALRSDAWRRTGRERLLHRSQFVDLHLQRPARHCWTGSLDGRARDFQHQAGPIIRGAIRHIEIPVPWAVSRRHRIGRPICPG
jgi:putative alpha-1,2-mannosidase